MNYKIESRKTCYEVPLSLWERERVRVMCDISLNPQSPIFPLISTVL
jgi:hypothetical protein